MVIEFSSPL